MDSSERIKACANFTSREKGVMGNGIGSFNNLRSAGCRECAYFSSRNCGMDTMDAADFYY